MFRAYTPIFRSNRCYSSYKCSIWCPVSRYFIIKTKMQGTTNWIKLNSECLDQQWVFPPLWNTGYLRYLPFSHIRPINMLGTSAEQLRKAGIGLDISVHTCVRLSGRMEQRESHQTDFFFNFMFLIFTNRCRHLSFFRYSRSKNNINFKWRATYIYNNSQWLVFTIDTVLSDVGSDSKKIQLTFQLKHPAG